MIKINLLPVEEKKEIRGFGQFVMGVFLIVAVLGVLVAAHVTQVKRIEDTNRRIAEVKKQVKGLEGVISKVDEFKAKNKELEERIKVIGVLEENRTGPLFVMDALGQSMPERAWIDKFSESKYIAKIEGIAWSELTVADLMKKLQSSPYFQNVELSVIKTKDIQKLPLKTFSISSTLNYSGKNKKEETEKDQEIKPNGREAKR